MKKYTVVRHCRSYTLRIKNQFILKKNIFKCYFWRNKYTRIAIFWLCTCICQFMKTIKHIPIYAVTNLKFIHKIRGRGIKLCIPVFSTAHFKELHKNKQRYRRSVDGFDKDLHDHTYSKMVLIHVLGNTGSARDHLLTYMRPGEGDNAWRRAATLAMRHFTCVEVPTQAKSRCVNFTWNEFQVEFTWKFYVKFICGDFACLGYHKYITYMYL